MERVVVSGATSMLGSAVIRNCIEHGVEVLAICREGSYRRDRIPQSSLVTIMECNLPGYCNLDVEGRKSYDTFFHFAWMSTTDRNNMDAQVSNIRYTLDAVALAHRLGCRTFVGAGSQAEYGRCEEIIDENTPTRPENGYGMAKLCAGQMAILECEKHGITCIWPRIFSVYGPGDFHTTMVSSLIEQLLDGKRPQTTLGEQLWEFLYCDDAAEALIRLSRQGKHGNIYCVGSGRARPLKEYIEELRMAVNSESEIGVGEVPYGEKQIMHLQADITKLQRLTGFEPQITFEKGIRRTVAWAREHRG